MVPILHEVCNPPLLHPPVQEMDHVVAISLVVLVICRADFMAVSCERRALGHRRLAVSLTDQEWVRPPEPMVCVVTCFPDGPAFSLFHHGFLVMLKFVVVSRLNVRI